MTFIPFKMIFDLLVLKYAEVILLINIIKWISFVAHNLSVN